MKCGWKEGINVGTIRWKNPGQGLTSAKDLTIELPERMDTKLLTQILNDVEQQEFDTDTSGLISSNMETNRQKVGQ